MINTLALFEWNSDPSKKMFGLCPKNYVKI